MDEKSKLDFCQEKIGYRFQREELLKTALTHTSYASTAIESNERMEFLGDSVLGLVITDTLYHRFPDYLEGTLSIIKGTTVSRRSCAKVGQAIELEKSLLIGHGINHLPDSLLANAIEALIAAIYLDGGLEPAREFIDRFFQEELFEASDEIDGANFKAQLQTMAQHLPNGSVPTYILLDEKGPDHRKCFKIQVKIEGTYFQAAWGNNKKDAAQKAAENAIAQLHGEIPPWPDGDH